MENTVANATPHGRICPFNDCGVWLPLDMFACKPHWFSLSTQERRRIWRAFKDYRNGIFGLEQLRRIQQDVLGDRGKV